MPETAVSIVFNVTAKAEDPGTNPDVDPSTLPNAPEFDITEWVPDIKAEMTYLGTLDEDAVKAEIIAAFAKEGVTVKDLIVDLDEGKAVGKADDGTLITVDLTPVYLVTLDGTPIGYVDAKGTAKEGIKTDTPVAIYPKAVAENRTTNVVADGAIDLSKAEVASVTGEIALVTAYKVWYVTEGIVDKGELEEGKGTNYLAPGGKWTALEVAECAEAATICLPANTQMMVQAKAGGDETHYVQLKAGENLKGNYYKGDAEKTLGDESKPRNYSYTVSAADANEEGEIELKEAKLYNVTVGSTPIGMVEVGTVIEVSGGKVDDTYLAVVDDEDGHPSYIVKKASVIKLAEVEVEEETVVGVTISGDYARGDGTILLLPAAQLHDAGETTITEIVVTRTTGETVAKCEDTIHEAWVVVGATMKLTGTAADGADENMYFTKKATTDTSPVILGGNNGAKGTDKKTATATVDSITIDLGANFDSAGKIATEESVFVEGTGLLDLNKADTMAVPATALSNLETVEVLLKGADGKFKKMADGAEFDNEAELQIVFYIKNADPTKCTFQEINDTTKEDTVIVKADANKTAKVVSVRTQGKDAVLVITIQLTVPADA